MVGNRIKAIRVQKGMNQKELARRTGRTQSQISKIECGARQLKVQELDIFAKALGVSVAELLGEKDVISHINQTTA